MISLTLILGVIVLLFFFLLFVKQFIPPHKHEIFCVLCGAVSTTWLVLLVLFWLGKFTNTTLLAVFMGSSVTGIYYLLDAQLPRWRIFRLPFFLTLIVAVYSVLKPTERNTSSLLLLSAVWLLFGFFFVYRNNTKLHSVVERIIACCKNW